MNKLLFGLALFSSSIISSAHAEEISVMLEDYPPYTITSHSSELSGIEVDLLQIVFKEANIKVSFHVYPWSRGFAKAEHNKNTCSSTTVKTAERTPRFKWAGPMFNSDWVLLGKAGSPTLSSLDDAKKYKIGGYLNDAMTNYLIDQGLNVSTAVAHNLNAKKLMNGEIDYWGAYNIENDATMQGDAGGNFHVALKIKTDSFYMACNKGVSDKVIQKLSAAFKKCRENGSLKKIVAKYDISKTH